MRTAEERIEAASRWLHNFRRRADATSLWPTLEQVYRDGFHWDTGIVISWDQLQQACIEQNIRVRHRERKWDARVGIVMPAKK